MMDDYRENEFYRRAVNFVHDYDDLHVNDEGTTFGEIISAYIGIEGDMLDKVQAMLKDAYEKGRQDQREETRALLRGVLRKL